jgi:hypothetical protein
MSLSLDIGSSIRKTTEGCFSVNNDSDA